MTGRLVRWLLSLPVSERALVNGHACRLTIVRHHRVYAADQRPLYRLGVAEDVFAAQLELLAGLGLGPVTVAEGLAFLDAGRPGHRVAMTFDDGYADNVTRALPLLQRHGARATFSLTAGWIERRETPAWDVLAHALETTRAPRLDWTGPTGPRAFPLGTRAEREHALGALLGEVREPPARRAERLAALRAALGVREAAPCALATWDECARLTAAGMEVGAHTLSHPWLTRLPAEEQRAEIAGSAERIAERLGVRPTGFAYPGGDHDDRTIAAARDAGLAHAVTTRAGVNGPETARLALRRRGLSDGACLGPAGGFSRRLAIAELRGRFDRARGVEAAS